MSSSKKLACIAFCLAHVASAISSLGITKRATTQAPAPTTIDIPLHFDGSGRYIIPVGMSSGANQQNFNFTLATSTGLTSVAGVGCSSCSDISLYNQSASSTAQSLNGNDSVALVGGSFSGSVIKEDCSMSTTGSAWVYNNQTIVVAHSQQNGTVLGSGASGLLGLGTNRLSSTQPNDSSSGYMASFSDSIFSRWLQNNADQESFQFGMDILPPVVTPTNSSGLATAAPTSTDAGTLHWLAPDTSKYNQSGLTYKDVQSNSSLVYSTGSQPDWTVLLDGWKVSSGGDSFESQDQIMVTVDPYYTDIYFPAKEAEFFNAVISGSSVQSGLSTLGSQSQAWSVPCDTKVSLSININDQTFTLDQSALVRQSSSGTCFSGVEGWTDSSIEQYIFGALFVSQVYLIFNVGRNGTDAVGFAPKVASRKGTKVGAIVGGTIGGVVGVLLVGIAAFFYLRSRQDRAILKDTVAVIEEHKVANTIQPFTLGAAAPRMGSPGVDVPLMTHHEDDVPPPAYEASEVGGSPTIASGGPMRMSKSEYVNPAPVQAVGEGSSRLSQPPRVEPNRMYHIEE
ncbi:acid protease [Daedalea quercina L-15889]|uniref:Acid protease n=1 Tax=Daedalea quercina L-15889 TaxID=1314783 RepID=A0A165PPC9_9APHY|nr:acid protease [Daedalea quercina L-15889]